MYKNKISGKEYNINDKLLYEGKFLKGERNWKGKEYDFTYQNKALVKFEGEYLHDKRNGKEKIYHWKVKFYLKENI